MQITRRTFASVIVAIMLLTACGGGSDPVADVAPAPTEVPAPVGSATTSPVDSGSDDPDPAATVGDDDASATPGTEVDETTEPALPVAGDPPGRFCVDFEAVETTLNLRSEPSTDSEILASLEPSSCDMVSNGTELVNNFQPVIYWTAAGAVDGWVSNNFIVSQDPPTSIEAAALRFVDAWQVGADTTQFSYGLQTLSTPIAVGSPIPVEGPAGFGCALEGDVTVVCAFALVESNGTEVARLEVFGSQRGTNGYDGEPYFAPDFPDGPTITGFSVLG